MQGRFDAGDGRLSDVTYSASTPILFRIRVVCSHVTRSSSTTSTRMSSRETSCFGVLSGIGEQGEFHHELRADAGVELTEMWPFISDMRLLLMASPEPRTSIAVGNGSPALLEGFENPFQQALFHTDAGIAHDELEIGAIAHPPGFPDAEVHAAPFRGKFQRIGQNIDKHLIEAQGSPL